MTQRYVQNGKESTGCACSCFSHERGWKGLPTLAVWRHVSPQPICEGTAVFHGAGSCSALLRGHGLQELVAPLASQPSASRLFLMATPSPASSSSLGAQCSRPRPAWRRHRRASGAKPCFLRNHIPHPSRDCSWALTGGAVIPSDDRFGVAGRLGACRLQPLHSGLGQRPCWVS